MGKVSVVGIGPGSYAHMTIQAEQTLRCCDVILGYQVYVELVRGRYPDKEFVSSPMTKEAERCRMALGLARSGKMWRWYALATAASMGWQRWCMSFGGKTAPRRSPLSQG